MGFDITYHAIRRDEMERCFFAPMKALKDGEVLRHYEDRCGLGHSKSQ